MADVDNLFRMPSAWASYLLLTSSLWQEAWRKDLFQLLAWGSVIPLWQESHAGRCLLATYIVCLPPVDLHLCCLLPGDTYPYHPPPENPQSCRPPPEDPQPCHPSLFCSQAQSLSHGPWHRSQPSTQPDTQSLDSVFLNLQIWQLIWGCFLVFGFHNCSLNIVTHNLKMDLHYQCHFIYQKQPQVQKSMNINFQLCSKLFL